MGNLISVVDDDSSVRESLESLIKSVGHEVRVFASAEEFLDSPYLRQTDCLILDVRMPGIDGIELHRHLVNSGFKTPVIFMTAHESDHHARSQAYSNGAVAYLIKPFTEDELLDAAHAALNTWKQDGDKEVP